MFRTFASLAILAFAATAVDTQEIIDDNVEDGDLGVAAAETACQLQTADYGVTFSLLDLEKDTAYTAAVDGQATQTL